MKKYNKNFTFYIFISLIFIAFFIVLQNVINDPFSVFSKTNFEAIKNKKYLPNERYIKMKYILSHKNKYDSFLIGSCTSNFINLDNIPNQKWYNLTYTNTTIAEMYRSFKLLVDNNVKIDRILMQISEASLKDSPSDYINTCQKYLNFCSYPISFDEKISFWSRYLFYAPFINSAKYDIWIDSFKRNIFKGGSFIDELPNDFSQMYKTKYETFTTGAGFDNRKYDLNNIDFIKEIVNICNQKNIEFRLFIIPEYIDIYLSNDLQTFNDFKRKLVLVTPFYDFTGLNKIAINKMYFTDPIHINNWASKLIVDRLFFENKNDTPSIKGYGVYVTQKNIDEHIHNLESEIKIYNK